MPYVSIDTPNGLMMFQELCGECTRRGAFFTSHHNWFLSTAHTDADIQQTWDIFDDALKAVKQRY
jgi:glutamate-1-semialdehyde 2,1-aminomutase